MGSRIYMSVLGRFTSTDPVDGGNANAYVYPGDPVNDQDISGQCIEDGCIGEGFVVLMILRYSPVAFEALQGFLDNPSPGGSYLTTGEKAEQLSEEFNKNSIQLRSGKQITHFDLRGATHYNKKPGEYVPTPHVQVRRFNNGFPGNKGNVRPMTDQDLRILYNYRNSLNR